MACAGIACVEDTALAAACSKWSAASQGYYDDPYIQFFVEEKRVQGGPQNFGYCVRERVIWSAVERFCRVYGSDGQVVVLGCGYDTLYWRCRQKNLVFRRWFDVDLESVIGRKIAIIEKCELSRDGYEPVSCQLESVDDLVSVLRGVGFVDAPTLFIDEFSLIYINEESYQRILLSISKLEQAEFVGYGLTNRDTPFGAAVEKTFQTMGAPLKSYRLTQTKEMAIKTFTQFRTIRVSQCNVLLKHLFDTDEMTSIMSLGAICDKADLDKCLSQYLVIFAGSEEFVSAIPVHSNTGDCDKIL